MVLHQDNDHGKRGKDGKSIFALVRRNVMAHRSIDRQRLLAELGAVAAETSGFDGLVAAVARLAACELADVCLVDVLEEDGSVRRAATACRQPKDGSVCAAFIQAPLDGYFGLARTTLETPGGAFIGDVTSEIINAWGPNDPDRAESARVHSVMVVGLTVEGKRLGSVLFVCCDASGAYTRYDVQALQAFADRAALFLHNARILAAARRATQARDDALAVVAHELRNPVAVILTLARILRKNGAESELSDQIHGAAARISRLIEDIVDITRLEAGRFTLERQRLPAARIMTDTFAAQSPFASLASLELQLDVSGDLPDIWADPNRLLQVFDNLIGNSIKFSKPGGRVTVGATPQDGKVLFSVTDTGCGIPSSHLPRIFERFWQGPGFRRQGVGLGLHIVKGIVQAHGGDVWVKSTHGQGSKFFFTIPMLPATEAEKSGNRHGVAIATPALNASIG